MTQSTLSTASAAEVCALITLSWGTNTARYTNWTDDISIYDGGDPPSLLYTFTSEPVMSIDSGEQAGGTEDKPYTLSLPQSRSPFSTLALPYAHAPVDVLIEEADPTDAEGTRRVVFAGRISKVTRNPSGQTLLVKVEIAGIKRYLTIALGITATTTCPWKFGDQQCKFNVTAEKITGTVSTLNVDSIATRIQTDQAPGSGDLFKWVRGYVTVDGLTIMARSYVGSGKFDLAAVPPPSWEGATAVFTPGCDKNLSTCKLWDNEENFGGIGIAIPAYNPVFQDGGAE